MTNETDVFVTEVAHAMLAFGYEYLRERFSEQEIAMIFLRPTLEKGLALASMFESAQFPILDRKV